MSLFAPSRRAMLGAALAPFAIGKALAQAPAPQPGLTVQPVRPEQLQIRPIVRRRRNVGSMAIDDPVLVSYRKAVLAMRALPASDARNWENQAKIHQDHCPHGNWYFLPWHRAYLYAFERICQQLSGDSGFRLPYWNWTVDRSLPASFTVAQVDGQPNPLRHTRPATGLPLPDNIVGSDVIEDILDETTFTIFASGKPAGQNSTAATWQRAAGSYGPLEGTPHNSVHGRIGGDMGTYMSPRDPIFWLHHCNIDRLWDAWRRRGNADTTDAHWADFRFSGQFVLGNGTTQYQPQCKNLSNVRSLAYEYVPQLVISRVLTDRIRALGVLQRVDTARLLAAPAAMATAASADALSFNVTLPPPALAAVQRAARAPTAAAATAAQPEPVPFTQGRVLARIAAVPPGQAGVAVRVFLGLPSANAETSVGDPHYVGTFSFFDDPSAHAGHAAPGAQTGAPPFVLDVTRTVQRLARAGQPVGAETTLVLVPVLPGGTAPRLTVREVTLAAA